MLLPAREKLWGFRLTSDDPNETRDVLPYLAAERELTAEARALYAAEWRVLASEPWPLRVFTEGALSGAPETFYDSGIKSFIPCGEEFRPIQVILDYFRAMRGYPYSITMSWRVAAILGGKEFRLVRREDKNEYEPYWDPMKHTFYLREED